jgi:uncharacterized metal-binding protein YceD (DUF177 family)
MMRAPIPPAGPLSRRFDVATVRDGATAFRVESTAAERDAIAAECELPGLDALEGDYRVSRDGAAGLRVTGTVTARVRQICVVTLEEFPSDLSEPVDVRFAPADDVEEMEAARAARPPASDEEDEPDLPDPIVNGRIDLGALTAEILVLSLDPYPKKPGASFAEPEAEVPDEAASPFAALRGLKGPGEV